jgi:hypothetical protein
MIIILFMILLSSCDKKDVPLVVPSEATDLLIHHCQDEAIREVDSNKIPKVYKDCMKDGGAY